MLSGRTVTLRPVEQRDLGLLVEWRNDPRNWAQFFNRFPLSLDQQQAFYSKLQASATKKLFMICLQGDEPIGTVGLDHLDPTNQSAEFGNMLIGPSEHLGKGYAREAAELLIGFCFRQLNLRRLYLYVFEDNARARTLYEALGFQVEGTLRQAHFAEGRFKNLVLMSLLRDEWPSP